MRLTSLAASLILIHVVGCGSAQEASAPVRTDAPKQASPAAPASTAPPSVESSATLALESKTIGPRGDFLRYVPTIVDEVCACGDLACATRLMSGLRQYQPLTSELDEAARLSERMKECVKRLRPSQSEDASFNGDGDETKRQALDQPGAVEGGDDTLKGGSGSRAASVAAGAPTSPYPVRMRVAVDAVCACHTLACAVEASKATERLEPGPDEMVIAVAEGRRLRRCMQAIAEQAAQ